MISNKYKLFPLVIGIAMLAGCQTTGRYYGEYNATEGTVHSLYPFQLMGYPQTANERLQVKSRGECSTPPFSFLVGNQAIDIVGHMVRIDFLDKKKWPEYGYLSRPIEVSAAADGTNNYEAYIIVENVEYKDRNKPTKIYGEAIYKLSWNDEKMNDGWMHGDFEFRGISYYEGDTVISTASERFSLKAKCLILGSDTYSKLKIIMALDTMTPEQKAAVPNQQ